MYFETNDGKMNYEVIGKGKTIIFLHGWGQNLNTFNRIATPLKDEYRIILVDFLGFGLSDEPEHVIGVDNYVNHLRSLIEYLDIKSPILIAHSFGGRVAIKYAAKYFVDKLVLVDSAGIKVKSFKKCYKIMKYKLIKKFYYYFFKTKYEKLIATSGSVDYKNASPIMKGVLSKVVNEDLKKYLKKLTTDTLIIWGIFDNDTLYKHGQIMNKLIRKSKLINFYKSGHFPYIDEEKKFINELRLFLKRIEYV